MPESNAIEIEDKNYSVGLEGGFNGGCVQAVKRRIIPVNEKTRQHLAFTQVQSGTWFSKCRRAGQNIY
jgi:hypothetical protein